MVNVPQNRVALARKMPFQVLWMYEELSPKKLSPAMGAESEAKYRSLFESSRDALMINESSSGKFTAVSVAAVEMFGAKNTEELLSLTPWELSPERQPDGRNSAEKVREMIETTMRAGSHFFEWKHKRVSGEEFAADVLLTRMEHDGKVFHQATVRDISERKRTEEQLRLQNAALEAASNGIFITDSHGIILWVNPAFGSLTGWSPEEVIGKTPRILKSGKQDTSFYRRLCGTITAGRVWHGEMINRRRDGSLYTKEMTITPVRNERGEIANFIAINQNVTQQRVAERALRVRDRAFDTSVSALATSDMAGHLTYVNAAYVKMFGHDSVTEMLGKPFASLYADPAAVESSVRTVLEQGHWTGELKARRTDGTSLDVLVSASVATDDAGQPLCLVASLFDITDRKQGESALRESERRYSDMLHNVELISMALDRDARVTFCNDYLLRLTGWRREEVLGSNWFELFIPPQNDELKATFQSLLENLPTTWHYENEILTRSGERRSIRWNNTLLRSTSGEVVGTASIGDDITEYKRAETSLQETNYRLQDALENLNTANEQAIQQENLRALGTMASGIAHDFNNSLTAILGCSELLLSRPDYFDDKEKTRNYIETMNTAAQDAGNVVNRLREFYRHREEREVFVPANINELVGQAVALTQPKWKAEAEAHGVSVNVHTDLQEVPLIAGNDGNLREVLTNLIFNAVDAMPRGGTITIRTYRDDGHVVLEISDTGTGMTEEVRRRCLEPFFTTKGERGTGLGLSMIYGIIQRHQGTIDIETEVGKGTTFIIHLPVLTAQPRSEPKAQPVDAVQPLHVLVVDDEAVVRRIVGEYLKLDGHIVEVATNGHDGLEKFRNSQFDLVLVDRAMPGMSGDQVAATIKSAEPKVPVVMLTGFGSMMDAADEKPAGVDLVLGKPVTINALRAALSKAIASVN